MSTSDKPKNRKRRQEIRVGVRSGSGTSNGTGVFPKVKVAIVSGGSRPMLWLGEGERQGLAWISGRDTLRRLRDALDEILEEER